MTDLPLGAFFIDIGGRGPTGNSFPTLSGIADRAFTHVEQPDANVDTSNTSRNVHNRFASILYPVGYTDAEPIPVKAILHQTLHGMQVQQVIIDFRTRTAEYEGLPHVFIEPDQIEHAEDEVKPYLRDMWRRNKDQERERYVQEHRHWKAFLEHLKLDGLLATDAHSVIDASYTHKRCPLCETQTITCTTCPTILCWNSACAASRLTPFQSCSQHASSATCLPCLERENGKTDPPLGQCPECKLWFCHFELTWCLGRPKGGSSHPMISNSEREHPMKPIKCPGCSGTQEQRRCSNQKCWSRGGRCTSICESCFVGSGLWCTCEQLWICDDCKTSSIDYFKECPRCNRVYCAYECEYIQFCVECGRTTLCDDCSEEDWSLFSGPNVAEGVVVQGCTNGVCVGKICRDCEEGTRCMGCNKIYCSMCTRVQGSDSSDGRCCSSCYRTRKRSRS